MNDSGYYIGACQQSLQPDRSNHAWGEYSALGYSGSNSGGRLIVENSQFDNNEDGFDTNSQNGDNPPPQNGACPNNGISPITHTHSCWVFMHNYVHDNNNPNVPTPAGRAAGPVGTGMTISGGRNDTVMDNRFDEQQRLGRRVRPVPRQRPAVHGRDRSTSRVRQGRAVCTTSWGDALLDNTFSNDGGYGNPTQRRLRAAEPRGRPPTRLLPRQHRDERRPLTPDAAALQAK